MSIKIVFHEHYYNCQYATDPAATEGRLNGIMEIIKNKPELYEIVEPVPASKADILRAHSKSHYEDIKSQVVLYESSALAAGGAIMAAEIAFNNTPSFAVIRPPGHHASSESCWGFCHFNNMAISLLKLYSEKKIKKAFILDFDLHTGDGNINILEDQNDEFTVSILNPKSTERGLYLQEVEGHMENITDVDIFAASAGFDQGIDDWGHLLYPEDYTELGRLMKEYSQKICSGRRYAILEGGYNHQVIGSNVDSFCRGFA
ncbi:histone deacetylase family protein [Desulfobacula sp.]|uniref:histone deacetylase family protein n=1 Tax=Desulfobacula sp. TaxID=2593537 RepID=UPI0025C3A3BC|nr:histone deacetylase family protein [Desulfobacula sp.]